MCRETDKQTETLITILFPPTGSKLTKHLNEKKMWLRIIGKHNLMIGNKSHVLPINGWSRDCLLCIVQVYHRPRDSR